MMMMMSDKGGRGGCSEGISSAGMDPPSEYECCCREDRHGDPYGGDHVPISSIDDGDLSLVLEMVMVAQCTVSAGLGKMVGVRVSR
mmetsp:Transcript_10277/g.18871  ORF Transcript_10277/g.18871 Transcript_10277/m.18871 type:complete len:86 (-) Transcript_10277:41-298(-)